MSGFYISDTTFYKHLKIRMYDGKTVVYLLKDAFGPFAIVYRQSVRYDDGTGRD